jgi:hypothetical protein
MQLVDLTRTLDSHDLDRLPGPEITVLMLEAALPPSGFMVGFFPIKLAHCSAAPAQVVGFVDGLPAG